MGRNISRQGWHTQGTCPTVIMFALPANDARHWIGIYLYSLKRVLGSRFMNIDNDCKNVLC
jgi:hypothetical protein